MDQPSPLKLTEWTSCGGCAAKWGGAPLGRLVRELAAGPDSSLLVGLAPFDDAAVYKLSDDTALVSTTDFFPPLVDEPADFGAVAAANACSDVFAMGGRVLLALNIAAFPEEMPPEVIAEILAAAAETVRSCGGTVAGGHTIRSPEPIFGLAVQGVVNPARVWSKAGARPGDRLLLSKPLGTGIVLAGGDEPAKQAVIAGMRTLNEAAARTLSGLADPDGRTPVHAVTDVTGFGLAGHGWEMAERSATTAVIDGSALPLYPRAAELAAGGVKTGGEARNRSYLGGHLASSAAAEVEALVLDPQTSGGLLAAVDPAGAGALIDQGWWEVGRVEDGPAAVRLI
ncbi:MAG TPA: selenide, water dikinase SelD [Acidimicrobiales bacterium]|nr:selenide, water dikinase SelD [Acidimicrobiales bacterium]